MIADYAGMVDVSADNVQKTHSRRISSETQCINFIYVQAIDNYNRFRRLLISTSTDGYFHFV